MGSEQELIELNKSKKLYDFLHTKGYNAFTIPKLTPLEINFLVTGHNKTVCEQIKAQQRANKKAMRKR